MPRWDQSGTPIATAPTQAPKRWDEQGNPIETATDNRIAPVSAPKPPLPAGLIGPKAGEENSVGGSGNEPGLPAIVNQGIHQIGRAVPAFANSVSRGTSNLVEGAAKTLSPLALAGAVAAPVATVGALAGSTAADAAGRFVAHRLGASPDTEQAVGDVAGIAGGGLGGKGASVAGSAMRQIIPEGAVSAVVNNPALQAKLISRIPIVGPMVNDVRASMMPPEPYKSVPLTGLSRANGKVPVEYGRAPAGRSIVAGKGPPAFEPAAPVEPYKSMPLKMPNVPATEQRQGFPYAKAIVAGEGPPAVRPTGTPAVTPYRSAPLKGLSRANGDYPTEYDKAGPESATVGTRAEMMRQQRLAADKLRRLGVYGGQ